MRQQHYNVQKKSPSFCVVDNEITTNSIYYTTIPSNGDAHRIQTTIFYLVLKTYTIQLRYTPARPSLFLPFFVSLSLCLRFGSLGCRLPEKFLGKNIRHSRSKYTKTFIFVVALVWLYCALLFLYLRCHYVLHFPSLFLAPSVFLFGWRERARERRFFVFIAIENPSTNKCTKFVEFCFIFLMAVNTMEYRRRA